MKLPNLLKKNYKIKFFLIFIILLISFLYGFTAGIYQIPPYKLLKNVKDSIDSSHYFKNKTLNKFEKCELKKTNLFYDYSHIFVGHAYGSPSKAKIDSFISPNLEFFIRKNSSKLNTIVFTGDVFSTPSIEKWKKLRTITGDSKNIYIAPGNHDAWRPDSNDVFKLSEFGKKNYPQLKYLDSTPLVLENSTQSNWALSKSTIDLLNNIESETVIIARHHSPITDLLSLVNSLQGKSERLETIEELSHKLKEETNYYWIIGDSGAHNYLPRLSCLTFKNHIFLLNGLGQVKDDSIILYHNENFLEYLLPTNIE